MKDGKKGTDGVGAYTLDLTNQNASVPCDYNGNVLGSIESTIARVYYAGVLQSDWSFGASFNGCTGSINASTGAVTMNSLTAESASVTITASKSGLSSMTVVYTLSKVRGGENGEDAVVYAVDPSVDVVQVDADGKVSPSSITCSKLKKVGAGDYSVTTEGYLMYKRSSDSSEQAYSSAVTLTASLSYIDFILYRSSTDKTVLDKERVPVVKDGKKGEDGDDGTSAYTLDLTNENASVPCDYNGNVISNKIQGTSAKVYYGGALQNDWSFSASFEGCSGSINASTGTVSMTGISEEEASVTITASKSGLSSMTAVYSLCKVRGGENGEPAVIYFVGPDVAAVRVSAEGLVVPSTIGCRKFKQVGSSVPMETQEGYLVFKRSVDSSELAYSSEVSLSADVQYIDFILYKSSTDKVVLDKERVPVLKDGAEGEPALQYQLFAPYSTVSMTSSGGVYPSSFVVTCKKRLGLGEYSNCADFYLLVWRWNRDTESWSCINTNGYEKSSTITVAIDANAKYTMYKVCAYKEKPTSSTSHDGGTSEVEPRVFNVVRDGSNGLNGENGYFPRDRGFYDPEATYYWRKEGNETYRDKVVCEVDGVYYNFIVASMNNESGVTARPTLSGGSDQGNSDGNWEVMSVYRTLIVDTLFGSKANIGGFMTSNETMVSQTNTNGEPNIYMNGKTGEFRCTNAFVRGEIEATSGNIGDLSIENGGIIARGERDGESLKNTTYVNTLDMTGLHVDYGDNDIVADFGINYFTFNTEGVGYFSAVSLRNFQAGSRRSDNMCGVYISGGSDDIGVWIDGCGSNHIRSSNNTTIWGLVLNSRIVTNTSSMNSNDDVILFNNTSSINFTLSTDAPAGKVIYLKRSESSTASVTIKGNLRGSNSMTGSVAATRSLGDFSLMYVKTDKYWTEFYCG